MLTWLDIGGRYHLEYASTILCKFMSYIHTPAYVVWLRCQLTGQSASPFSSSAPSTESTGTVQSFVNGHHSHSNW